jgi:hypothetical protein
MDERRERAVKLVCEPRPRLDFCQTTQSRDYAMFSKILFRAG